MYKGLITEPMPLFEEEKRKYYNGIIDVVVAEKTDENYLIDRIADFDVLQVVYAKVTKSIIEAGKKLKVIARYGIGTDNINVTTATKLSIPVVYAPEYHIPSVPEHILALIFTLARQIPEANKSVKSGEWDYKKFCGIDIEGKVLGIIGLGRIGKSLAKKAIALRMKVIGYDPYLPDNKVIKDEVSMKSLEQVIRESDFLVLCIPLTQETKGFINKSVFSQMKSSAFLINASRGPIINESDFYDALFKRKIAGAAIDVMEKEPPEPQNRLLQLENLIITPHLAWFTSEAMQRLEFTVAEGIVDVLNGKKPKYVVNPEVF